MTKMKEKLYKVTGELGMYVKVYTNTIIVIAVVFLFISLFMWATGKRITVIDKSDYVIKTPIVEELK